MRAEARELLKQGIYPAHNRQTARPVTHAANANTFEAVAREWMAKKNCAATVPFMVGGCTPAWL
jgi:hypothetical protein